MKTSLVKHTAVSMAVFAVITVVTYYLLRVNTIFVSTTLSKTVYILLLSLIVGGIGALACFRFQEPARIKHGKWFYPGVAAGLTFLLFIAAYARLGVWPLGTKTVMVVDLHHQYGPLLSELREMLRTGGNFTYSFHVGLGTNFIPAFAYYLASPLNLLLLLFPENLLPEAVLVITLIKFSLAGGAFTLTVQGLYKRRNAATVALGIAYAMMGYMIAYSWNLMWLDVVVLAPITVLCLEHLLDTGKYLPYILTLALALFANYYIGFMLCIFLVLYFAVWSLRQRRGLKEWLTGGIRFGVCSLIAGGLAACLLVPTALALARTSAAGEEMPRFAANFPFFSLLERFFWGVSPTIRSGNLPNVYCGLGAVLLLPIYLSQKDIPLRRRLCYGGLLGIMLISCTLNIPDLLWHGLHTPNDLPYRFSFLVGLALLLPAGRVLAHPRRITPKQIILSLLGCAAYLMLWEYNPDENNAFTAPILYANLAFLAGYALLLLLQTKKRLTRQVSAILLLGVFTLELGLNAAMGLHTVDGNEYFTNHESYVDSDDVKCNAAALRRAQELAKEDEEANGFCRVELLPRTTCTDTSLYHYAGISTFASSNPQRTTVFMGKLGYAVNGVNSYMYNTFLRPADSLFGIRYVVMNNELTDHPQLELVDSVTLNNTTRYIYRNKAALSIGFLASNDIRNFNGTEYDPFISQQGLYECLLGEDCPLYISTPIEAMDENNEVELSGFVKRGEDDSTFAATVTEEGQYYAYAECSAAEAITVTSYDLDGVAENTFGVGTNEPYVVDLGVLLPGQRVETTISSEETVTGNIYVMKLNTDVEENALAALAEGNLTVTSFDETEIKATVTAQKASSVFFSMTYDKGWQVKVDGRPVETFPIDATADGTDGALLGCAIGAGEHEVVLTYKAPGQTAGICITVLSALVLIAPWVYKLIKKKAKKGK